MVSGCLEAAVGSVRVVVVDDQPDIRLLLRVALDQPSEGLAVVGDAPDAMSALTAIDETRPDVVILDHMMPGITGIELAGTLLARWPDLVIVLCSAWITDELRVQAREAGIRAAVNKTSISELPALVRTLADALT
jgi:DNA-binding NarL/FixJ family response regulator